MIVDSLIYSQIQNTHKTLNLRNLSGIIHKSHTKDKGMMTQRKVNLKKTKLSQKSKERQLLRKRHHELKTPEELQFLHKDY